MKDPAFLFYFNDFMADISLMDLTESGAYIQILCHQAKDGHLSLKKLQVICKTETISDLILSRLEIDVNGNYFNAELDENIRKRKEYSASRRANFNKTKKGMTNHMLCPQDTHMDDHMINININTNKAKNGKKNKEGKGVRGVGEEPPYQEIIDDLNAVAGTKYQVETKGTKEKIDILWKKWKMPDFIHVHRIKFSEWKGTRFENFLRPTTLYQPEKFESYVNQREIKPPDPFQGIKDWYTKKEKENEIESQEIIDVDGHVL